MASSGLRGPFPLTENGIDTNVTETSPGAYRHEQSGEY
jgi:hypothetical protein